LLTLPLSCLLSPSKGERRGKVSNSDLYDFEPYDLDNCFSPLMRNEVKGCLELKPKDVEDEGEG
jgi:hypothetical protein